MFRYYDLTVTLDDVRPPPWRRFQIAADATFADLHRAIQDACGWENYHLYEFSSATGEHLAGPRDVEWDERPVRDASTVQLSAALDADHATVRYVYDFGDDWQHTVRRESAIESPERFHRRLVGGALAFPPEDCGGIGGYEQCLDIVRGGADEEGVREWLGDWDPERFDLESTRSTFDGATRLPGPASPFFPGFPPPADLSEVQASPAQHAALAAAAERVGLLTRLRVFTGWAGSGRKLTASGNLTMAAGAELIGLLGTDDRLDPRVGDRVFRTRSTVELPGVDFTFRLARHAGFVKVRTGAVSATKRGSRLGGNPLDDWLAAVRGLLDLGVLRYRYAGATWIDPYWKEAVDEQVPGLLAHLLVAGFPVPVVDLQERLWQFVEASFVLDDLDQEQRRRHRDLLDHDVRRICRALADLAAIEVTDVETIADVHGYGSERGGQVALTPLGVAAVRELAGRR